MLTLTLQVKCCYPRFPDLENKTQSFFPWFLSTRCALISDGLPFLTWRRSTSLSSKTSLKTPPTATFLPCTVHCCPIPPFPPPPTPHSNPASHIKAPHLARIRGLHSHFFLLYQTTRSLRLDTVFCCLYIPRATPKSWHQSWWEERMKERRGNGGHRFSLREVPTVARLWKNQRRPDCRCWRRTRVILGLRKHWRKDCQQHAMLPRDSREWD